MSVPMDNARQIADAVLYEGYLLYPYRASAAKNRLRWQFGVLMPPHYTATAEPSTSVTECLLEGGDDAALHLRLRFLHVNSRTVEQHSDGEYHPVPELTGGETIYLSFDEATEREAEAVLTMTDLLSCEHSIEVHVAGDCSAEPIASPTGEHLGRIVAEQSPIDARLRVTAERRPGPYTLTKLRIEIRNTTEWDRPDAPREQALRRALVATHLIIGTTRGGFVSLIDPPEWARAAVRACRNQHTWPVLVGEPGDRDLILSSPIILDDYPGIAPESQGDLFDATEIDEMLHLRTITRTDDETREAAATDPRAAEILRRAHDLPPELVERLHGAIRHIGTPTGTRPETPWWDPGGDPHAAPETDRITVSGVPLAKGSRVRLNPGKRRADAHDMFLAGKIAHVEAVFLDVDGSRHLAVTLADDPAADLHRTQGRFLYFGPDEVEPLGEEEATQ